MPDMSGMATALQADQDGHFERLIPDEAADDQVRHFPFPFFSSIRCGDLFWGPFLWDMLLTSGLRLVLGARPCAVPS